jgi:hypothetical protein
LVGTDATGTVSLPDAAEDEEDAIAEDTCAGGWGESSGGDAEAGTGLLVSPGALVDEEDATTRTSPRLGCPPSSATSTPPTTVMKSDTMNTIFRLVDERAPSWSRTVSSKPLESGIVAPRAFSSSIPVPVLSDTRVGSNAIAAGF